ncbi:MAG: LysM peptidoglycan-binding domain-containing protein [Pseudomonadales bacterium]|nr:LysM peptidoglycan-binding domain-containing protein [Pseudomonadales bacterium]
MLKSLIGLLSISLMTTLAFAEPVPLKSGHPERHYVERGDTLWGIAESFLNDPWLWPEIWHINDQIENPHLIYPGDIIKLVYIGGVPKLTVERAGQNVTMLADGTIKLSPKARVTPLDSVIPAIPLDKIQSFLVDHRIVERGALDDAPYILAGGEEHILMGTGDMFYARGEFTGAEAAFGVYRGGEVFKDPDTGEVLGFEALELGLSRVMSVEGDIARLRLLSANEDVRIGDRLLETEERKVDSVFYPKSPADEIEGRIIHVFGGVRNVSQYSVVVLNKGDRDNLGVGDVLAVHRVGAQVRDRLTNELIQLPSEKSGLVIVFRTFEKLSFALVLTAQRTLKVFDEVKNP